MYESPVEIISKQIRFEQEEGIVRAIQEYGIIINKEELIKAINYDRNQYQKGYDDGFADAKDQAQLDLTRLKENLAEAHLDIKEHMAEIERFVVKQYALKAVIKRYEKDLKNAKSEAIKEFAERFKDKAGSIVTSCQGYEIYETKQYQISAINFDNLVKEMTEVSEK